VQQAIVANRGPPRLFDMLLIFVGLQMFAEVVIMVVLVTARVVLYPGHDKILGPSFRTRYVLDVVLSLVFVNIVLYTVVGPMSDTRRFNYEAEGSRAIRALQELIVALTGVVYLIPFFLIFG
jgi:uncharacterized membrane protein